MSVSVRVPIMSILSLSIIQCRLPCNAAIASARRVMAVVNIFYIFLASLEVGRSFHVADVNQCAVTAICVGDWGDERLRREDGGAKG